MQKIIDLLPDVGMKAVRSDSDTIQDTTLYSGSAGVMFSLWRYELLCNSEDKSQEDDNKWTFYDFVTASLERGIKENVKMSNEDRELEDKIANEVANEA